MRTTVDARRVEAFMRELGRRARGPGRVYLTGGDEIDERRIRDPGLDAGAFRRRARAFLEAEGG